ncbi:MAG TPA: glycoside hydrolase family 3 N-terminal domain-containing protein [Candidatus Bathyarchaeia archaeon]|nr:glycoside hydrolase family 3 N-terminal domain-containing protein [Candidatus Bathyarchaeia archaeon]
MVSTVPLTSLLAILAVFAAPAAVAANNFAAKPASPIAEEKPAAAPPKTDAELIDSKLELLDLRERVAQIMLVTMLGFEGPNNTDREMLKRCVPGGVVISAVISPNQAADYVKTLRSIRHVEFEKGIPLFIASDLYQMTQSEERLPVRFAQLPSLLSLGAVADMPATEGLAEMLAQHLTAMGFNMNLGPSLELAPTMPDAPNVTNTFGSDPAFTAQAGVAVIQTLLAGDIIPAPTGFPGGGNDRGERAPAALLTPRPRLASRELLPYKAAIDAGAPVVHVANTLVPTINAQSLPASLSPEVYRLLREELKFGGVIVAGPIDSSDIGRNIDPAQAAVMALEAGADMIYWAGSDKVLRGAESVAQAVQNGQIPAARLEESVRRILTLKRAHHLSARPVPERKKADALEKKKVANEAYAIERNSITLVKNAGHVLPLSKERSMPIGVTGVIGVDLMAGALEEYMKPILQQSIQTARHLGEIEDFEVDRIARYAEGVRTVVCIFTGMRKSFGEARVISELKAKGVRVVVLLLGYPKNLPQLVEADAILLAYCDQGRYGESIRAAADIIAGVSPIKIAPAPDGLTLEAGKPEFFDIRNVVIAPAGRMPVTIAPPFVFGYSVKYMPLVKKAQWDFGDGDKSKDPRAEHAYKTPGKYTVILTVTNPKGEKSSGQFPLVVE